MMSVLYLLESCRRTMMRYENGFSTSTSRLVATRELFRTSADLEYVLLMRDPYGWLGDDSTLLGAEELLLEASPGVWMGVRRRRRPRPPFPPDVEHQQLRAKEIL